MVMNFFELAASKPLDAPDTLKTGVNDFLRRIYSGSFGSINQPMGEWGETFDSRMKGETTGSATTGITGFTLRKNSEASSNAPIACWVFNSPIPGNLSWAEKLEALKTQEGKLYVCQIREDAANWKKFMFNLMVEAAEEAGIKCFLGDWSNLKEKL